MNFVFEGFRNSCFFPEGQIEAIKVGHSLQNDFGEKEDACSSRSFFLSFSLSLFLACSHSLSGVCKLVIGLLLS